MRNAAFILGTLIFLFGVVWHIPDLHVPLPFYAPNIVIGFGEGLFSLDVLALIAGTMIMIMSWVIHKLIES